MDLNALTSNKDTAVVNAILAIVAEKFKGEPVDIWLGDYTRADGEKAASALRADKSNSNWTFSVEAHGEKSCMLKIKRHFSAFNGTDDH